MAYFWFHVVYYYVLLVRTAFFSYRI